MPRLLIKIYDFIITIYHDEIYVCVLTFYVIDLIEQSDILVLCISIDRTDETKIVFSSARPTVCRGSPTELDIFYCVPIFASFPNGSVQMENYC